LHEYFKIAPVLWRKIKIWGRVSKEVFAEQSRVKDNKDEILSARHKTHDIVLIHKFNPLTWFSFFLPSSWTTKAVRWRYWPKHAAPSERIPQTPSCWRRTSRSPQSKCNTSPRDRVEEARDRVRMAWASRHQWMAVDAINPRQLAVIHPASAPVPWSSSNCLWPMAATTAVASATSPHRPPSSPTSRITTSAT